MNNTKTNPTKTTANKRLKAHKASRAAEKQTIQTLQNLIIDISDKCGLDEENMAGRISYALRRSEYGRVNGLINLLASIANWPVQKGDETLIPVNQQMIEREFSMDLMLLEDIKTSKGFHTMHNDALEVINGREPEYDEYEDNCAILLEELGCKATSAVISPDKWEILEAKAVERTEASIIELRQAVADHKALMA